MFYDPEEEAFNSLPNDKILDWSKLKAFADDKNNDWENGVFFFFFFFFFWGGGGEGKEERVENIV